MIVNYKKAKEIEDVIVEGLLRGMAENDIYTNYCDGMNCPDLSFAIFDSIYQEIINKGIAATVRTTVVPEPKTKLPIQQIIINDDGIFINGMKIHVWKGRNYHEIEEESSYQKHQM